MICVSYHLCNSMNYSRMNRILKIYLIYEEELLDDAKNIFPKTNIFLQYSFIYIVLIFQVIKVKSTAPSCQDFQNNVLCLKDEFVEQIYTDSGITMPWDSLDSVLQSQFQLCKCIYSKQLILYRVYTHPSMYRYLQKIYCPWISSLHKCPSN